MKSSATSIDFSRLPPSQLRELQLLASKDLCERHLYDFQQEAWHILEPGTEFVPNWHIGAICDHLEAVSCGDIRFLIINVPPRCMKSLLVSVCWPAWHWTRRFKRMMRDGTVKDVDGAASRWISASYAQMLSTRDSLKTRRLIESNWYQERWGLRLGLIEQNWEEGGTPTKFGTAGFELTGDQNAKMRFENSALGFRLATSVGGIGTGEGSDFQVIDDPHNVKEAESDPVREGTLMWTSEVMSTRFNDPSRGARVVVMQRVHARDVSGFLLEEGGYVHLCLPMRYEPSRAFMHLNDGSPNPYYVPPTPLGFEDPRTDEDELLWPDRFDAEAVDRLEKSLGPYAFAGQMQQRPTPRSGGMFRREDFQIVEAVPEDVKLRQRARSYDYAGTDPTKQKSMMDPDWTVGALGGLTMEADPDLYIEHIDRFRKDPGERDARVKQNAEMDGRGVVVWIEQEPGQSGKSQIVEARRMLSGFAVNPPRVDPMPARPGMPKRPNRETGVPSGSKITRAEALATLVYRKKVYLVRGEWNRAFLDEITTFPMGHHDDQVDAVSQLYLRLSEKPMGTAEAMMLKGYYAR